MDIFDEDLFQKGLAQRKATMGADFVEKNLASADDFTRPWQEAMTAWAWGFGWGDDTLDPKTRSLMNLAMIGAWARCTSGRDTVKGPSTMAAASKKFVVPFTWSVSIVAPPSVGVLPQRP